MLCSILRVFLVREFVFHNFDMFFAQFFNLPYFPDFSSNYYVKFNEVFCFWRISRTVTERLRILIHIYLRLNPNFGKHGKNALRSIRMGLKPTIDRFRSKSECTPR